MGTATGIIRALNSGIKHLAIKRFTLRYPEEKLKFVGDGYQFDPSTGVGIAGLKGRHMLFHDHCTGCCRRPLGQSGATSYSRLWPIGGWDRDLCVSSAASAFSSRCSLCVDFRRSCRTAQC